MAIYYFPDLIATLLFHEFGFKLLFIIFWGGFLLIATFANEHILYGYIFLAELEHISNVCMR